MPGGPAQARIEHAARHLGAGGLVVFPTDTVYGLGADLRNPGAVRAIFHAKGRPSDRPLPALVADADSARRLVGEWPPRAAELAARFWPGPLTLVLPAAGSVPAEALAGGRTIGVRCPDHPIALALLRAFGGALAVTSANRSGDASPVSADDVRRSLDLTGIVLLDAGPCPGGRDSTVLLVGIAGEPDRILRAGPLDAATLGLTA